MSTEFSACWNKNWNTNLKTELSWEGPKGELQGPWQVLESTNTTKLNKLHWLHPSDGRNLQGWDLGSSNAKLWTSFYSKGNPMSRTGVQISCLSWKSHVGGNPEFIQASRQKRQCQNFKVAQFQRNPIYKFLLDQNKNTIKILTSGINTEMHIQPVKYIIILTFINVMPLDKLSRHLMSVMFFPFKHPEIKLKL